MGVMLSILVACVGVIELLTCLKQVSNVGKSVVAPCLSYHDPLIENPSFHDSLCGISHSHDLSLPRSVRNKLENLHEYSLRVRSELKSHGFADGSTLSEFSSQDVFDGVSRADSRLSLDFDLVAQDAEEQWNSSERANVDIKIDRAGDEVDAEVLQLYLDAEKSSEYIRIPTPIPLALSQELSRSNSSIDVSVTFEQDSGNELPTRDSFERIPGVVRDGESRRSQSPEQCLPVDLGSSDCQVGEIVGNKRGSSGRKALKSTSVLRKATRLKSKNAEVSKSAENLSSRRKRHREPERRKSEISIQTSGTSRDEWTNTSPTDSERSISASRSSVSVQVQTNSASDEDSPFKWVLSESKRDTARSSRKAFVNKRVLKSKSLDDYCTSNDIDCTSSRFDRARNGWRTSRANEEDEIDEEFLDAEDRSSSQSGPIEYCIPSVEAGKAFWLIFSGEYTKAMNKDWHSGHFCCWQCDESLTGQRYVLRDEHPYCIKCYESVFANGCEECNKIIGIDSKDLSYKDKHWHEACFLCNKCRVSLVDKQFGSKVDKIYCGNCYDAQFASRCDGCGEIFRAGTKKMEYKTRQWHEKCFCCVVCKNPIGTKSFIPREQEIYCAGCYEDKFATRCVKCNKIITSGGVTYKNEPWHRDCFTCSHCDNSLAGQRFTSRDDKPYCAECFGELFAKRCTACTKPITGIGGTRFISFEDRHWHNDCFVCAGCKMTLVGRGFITDGDDIICPECAKQKLTE